jgi:soluble lytic murein transglycosylase
MTQYDNRRGNRFAPNSHFAFRAPTLAQAGAWAFLLVFALVTLGALSGRDAPATPAHEAMNEMPIAAAPPAAPTELSNADAGLYALLFQAEERGDIARSNALIVQLANRELVGYVLAARYLGGKYTPAAEELAQWLAQYSDHPQAERIARLARARGVQVALPKAPAPLRGDGYTDHLGRSSMPDSWFTALGLWREGDYAAAGALFTQISEAESLNDWQKSAAHYWAYRASNTQGAADDARTHLVLAAAHPTTFYGLLASAQLNRLNLAPQAPEVSDALRADKRAIRASLLVKLGRAEDAQTELRALYSATPKAERGGVVTLVSELDMPNLQMRLAKTPGLSEAEQLFANYPMPYYMVDLHNVMDSALLMAVARNESGFRDVARSEAGATGLMQLLPSTAKMVERRISREHLEVASAGGLESLGERLNDPAMNARYGAQYLAMLGQMPAIRNNLIHLLTGYNAGPGTVISWKAATRSMNDPLLYIESIPYAETRNYVMQVAAQYWVYQLMMEETPTTLKTLAKGQWPVVKVATQ